MAELSQNLVPIFSSSDSSWAYDIMDCLERAGIDVAVDHSVTAGSGGTKPAGVVVELLVPEDQLKQAEWTLTMVDHRKAGPVEQPNASLKQFAKCLVAPLVLVIVTSMIYVSTHSFRFAFTFFMSGAVPYFAIILPGGYIVQRRLRTLGYEWVTWADANLIHINRRKVPPAADIEVIPGFRRHVVYLEKYIARLDQYKRKARKRRHA